MACSVVTMPVVHFVCLEAVQHLCVFVNFGVIMSFSRYLPGVVSRPIFRVKFVSWALKSIVIFRATAHYLLFCQLFIS